MKFTKQMFDDIEWGKFAYCFGCEKFKTNMQDLTECPTCHSKELIFSS